VAAAAVLGLVIPAGAAAEPTCPGAPINHVYFNGTLSEGTLKLGSRASASGISATVTCGLFNLQTSTFTVPAGNVRYNPFELKVIGAVPLETTIKLDGPAEGTMSTVYGFNALGESIAVGYNSTMTAPVTSTSNVSALGVGPLSQCSDGPMTPTLTTGKSGSLEGTLLTGESLIAGVEGTLVANEFAVPKIEPSSTCSLAAAELSNTLIGLPLKPGEASITTKAFIKLQ
jgi:hypothetical protein